MKTINTLKLIRYEDNKMNKVNYRHTMCNITHFIALPNSKQTMFQFKTALFHELLNGIIECFDKLPAFLISNTAWKSR
jgi:hypothetical protein